MAMSKLQKILAGVSLGGTIGAIGIGLYVKNEIDKYDIKKHPLYYIFRGSPVKAVIEGTIFGEKMTETESESHSDDISTLLEEANKEN